MVCASWIFRNTFLDMYDNDVWKCANLKWIMLICTITILILYIEPTFVKQNINSGNEWSVNANASSICMYM